jgi:hypothetical protein
MTLEGDQRAAHRRERKNYAMSKTARQITNTIDPVSVEQSIIAANAKLGTVFPSEANAALNDGYQA